MRGPSEARGDTPEARSARNSEARDARIEIAEPTLQQEAEGIRPRAIWWVGIGIIAISAVLVLIAWWLVAPPTTYDPAPRPSMLERGLIDRASGGPDLHAAGAQSLERMQWVDRKAGTVRIPIDRAIDAVVADPKLIGARANAPSPVANPAPTPPQTSTSSSTATPVPTPARTNAASPAASSSTDARRSPGRDAEARVNPGEVAK